MGSWYDVQPAIIVLRGCLPDVPVLRIMARVTISWNRSCSDTYQVEMDKEVPAAEADGMAEQIARLLEVDDLQAEWQAAAEASDEVERLLRAV